MSLEVKLLPKLNAGQHAQKARTTSPEEVLTQVSTALPTCTSELLRGGLQAGAAVSVPPSHRAPWTSHIQPDLVKPDLSVLVAENL